MKDNSIGRNLTFAVCSNILRAILRLSQIAILTRLFSPEEFGEVAIVWFLSGIIPLISEAGLSTFVIKSRENRNSEVLITVTCLSLATFCAYLLLVHGNNRFTQLQQNAIGILLLLIVINSLMIVWRAIAEKNGLFKELAKLDLVLWTSTFVFSVSLAFVSGSILSIFIANFLSMIIVNALLFRKTKHLVTFLTPSSMGVGKCFRFTAGYFPKNFLRQLSFHIDILIASRTLSLEQLGIYLIARNLIFELVLMIAIPFSRVTLSQSANRDSSSLADLKELLRIACNLSLVITSMIFINSHLIVSTLFDSDFSQASTILQLLSIVIVARLVLVIYESSRDVIEERNVGMIYSLINLTVNVAIMFWLSDGTGLAFAKAALFHSIAITAFTLILFKLRLGIDGFSQISIGLLSLALFSVITYTLAASYQKGNEVILGIIVSLSFVTLLFLFRVEIYLDFRKLLKVFLFSLGSSKKL